jgi:hypothetical protein
VTGSGDVEVADSSASLRVKDSDINTDFDVSGLSGYVVLALGPVEIDGSTIDADVDGDADTPTLSAAGSGAITVRASQVLSRSVAMTAQGTSIKVGGSEVAGASTTSEGGTVTCAADYNASFVAIPSTC